MTKQVKSKKRVEEFGEVYTNEKEVDAMLKLVINESNRIESRFLEPAVGTGNFLIKVLQNKLKIIKKKYKTSKKEYERYVFLAVSSIYGIDILEDNILECRKRLLRLIEKQYRALYKDEFSDEFIKSVEYVLSKNIICGDGLTGLKNGYKAEPIIFSEWTMINELVKRKDYAMCDMVAYEEFNTDEREFLKPREIFETIHYREVYSLG